MLITCNINRSGRWARLIYGLAMILLAMALGWFWAWPAGTIWRWLVCGVALASGGLGVFEAWSGWCVVRAMGIKTPM